MYTANAIGDQDRYKGWLYEEEHRSLLQYNDMLSVTRKRLDIIKVAREMIFKRQDLNLDEKRIRMDNIYNTEKGLLLMVPDMMKSIRDDQKLYNKLRAGRKRV